MAKPSSKRSDLSEAALFAHTERIRHLDFLKKQQWTITNYVILIYGALFSIKHLPHALVSHEDSWLKGFAVLAGIGGLVCVLTVQRHMKMTREDIVKSENWIFGEYQKGEEPSERTEVIGVPGSEGAWCRDLSFLGALLLVIIGGAVLVIKFI